MLLPLILIHFSIISANIDTFESFDSFLDGFNFYDDNGSDFSRFERQTGKKTIYRENTPTCEQLSHTSASPFVVLILYKTSGRFLGMGSIIDKRTVVTASKVVDNSVHRPSNLYVVAGRLSPWWGVGSQVKIVKEVVINEYGLALAVLSKDLYFNTYVRPIKTAGTHQNEVNPNGRYAIFGVQRSSWDIPGEPTSKTNIYVMRSETIPNNVNDITSCIATFPNVDYNSTVMICTYANGTYCWGCLGSPTVSITKGDRVLQIGVVIAATYLDTDLYHIHVLVSSFDQWIRSHSLIGYKRE